MVNVTAHLRTTTYHEGVHMLIIWSKTFEKTLLTYIT